jgi:hypothetical protein
MFLGVALGVAALVSSCSTQPTADPGRRSAASTTSPPGAVKVAMSAVPPSCTAPPSLGPVSPTPSWPSGYQILDAVPGALAAQYPTVYGGLIAAPATPGESAVEINSHFIVLETVRDPALEAEVTAAYPAPLTVAFQITSRTSACLRDVQGSVEAMSGAIGSAGITVVDNGPGSMRDVVGVTACKPESEKTAAAWFARRWGDLVRVKTCQVIPSALSGVARSH